jgi:hypothetical protein
MNTYTDAYDVPVTLILPGGFPVDAFKKSHTTPGDFVSVLIAGEIEPVLVHYTRVTYRP